MSLHAASFDVAPLPSGWRVETAMARVMAVRMEQVARWGHTPEDDAKLPLRTLPEHARAYVIAAIEDLQFGNSSKKGRDRALHNLERAGAMILAAIDRLQLEDTLNLAAMTERLA